MNTKLFDDYLENSKYNNTSLAKALGISRSSLYRKKNGETEFTAPEMELACNLLGIKQRQRHAVFFD